MKMTAVYFADNFIVHFLGYRGIQKSSSTTIVGWYRKALIGVLYVPFTNGALPPATVS
jgi:hypothetical protein